MFKEILWNYSFPWDRNSQCLCRLMIKKSAGKKGENIMFLFFIWGGRRVFYTKNIQVSESFIFECSLSEGLSVVRSRHFSCVWVWGCVDEANPVTEDLLARVCWTGPSHSHYSTSALLVPRDGQQWATARSEIAEAAPCPVLHLVETCGRTGWGWCDWCCWNWNPKELNITLICIMSHWYGEALK